MSALRERAATWAHRLIGFQVAPQATALSALVLWQVLAVQRACERLPPQSVTGGNGAKSGRHTLGTAH
jgi:hypothetical protein